MDHGGDRDDEAEDIPHSETDEPSEPTTRGIPVDPSPSLKNFRHQPDMENFYRFIFENDLREEALAIMDELLAEKKKKQK